MDGRTQMLWELSFGQPVAEEERDDLGRYFVSTSYWRDLVAGNIDITFGVKGSGKSALYVALLAEPELQGRGVTVIAGERPLGNPAFKGLVKGEALGEAAFEELWRLYFLALVADVLRSNAAFGSAAREVIRLTENAGLIPYEGNLPGLLARVRDAVSRAQAPEASIGFDPATGAPTSVSAKLGVDDRSGNLYGQGRSFQSWLEKADAALGENALTVWVALDRLDVAFSGAPTAERECLRALLRVYLDCRNLADLRLKLFLRRDVMARLMEGGFTEASHLVRTATLGWEPTATLVNLVARRVVAEDAVCDAMEVDREEVLGDYSLQLTLLRRIISQIDGTDGIEWVLEKSRNGSRTAMPREVIQLLEAARKHELQRIDLGLPAPPDGALISSESLRLAYQDVSEVRLQRTIQAEHAKLAPYIARLERGKAQWTSRDLGQAWKLDPEEAESIANAVVEAGVLQRMHDAEREEIYVIPPLYQPALGIQEGS